MKFTIEIPDQMVEVIDAQLKEDADEWARTKVCEAIVIEWLARHRLESTSKYVGYGS